MSGSLELQILLMIIDKSVVLSDLLSLAGHLTDYLLHNMERRNKKLALLAQTSPGLLEWMRKQVSEGDSVINVMSNAFNTEFQSQDKEM